MTPKQIEQFNTMRDALVIISKHFDNPTQLRRKLEKEDSFGLSYEEALEGSFENIQATAATAVRGVRRIAPQPETESNQ